MPRFSPELRPRPAPELTGPAGEAGAEDEEAADEEAADEEAADEGASTANASGPTLGVQARIIQTDARLQPENINVNSV